ncbi:MAG: BamA/TamA family outer membrane protein [Gemmatimonadaceae bacterium]
MRLRFARAFKHPIFFVAAALVTALAPRARAQTGEIDCDTGDDKPVRSLSFIGNKTFSSDSLATRILTTPSSFTRRYFRFFGAERCYPDVGLQPDVANLKQYYLNNGFYDTKVDTIVRKGPSNTVDVTFKIDEGLPMLIDTLRITGIDSVKDTTAVLRDLRLKVGGRFGIELLVADMDTIQRRLNNSGYPHAEVYRSYNTNRGQHRATVELEVISGVFTRFGEIKVTGTSVRNGPLEINSNVVRRLIGFRPGDRYADNTLSNASRSLYNLGTYRHVGITVDTTFAHGDSVADVIVDLREDYMREYSQEEGWAILDCFRATAQYTDKNFLDNAQRLELTGRVSKIGYGAPTRYSGLRNLCYTPYLDRDSIASSKLNYYAGATLRRPTLFGTHWVPSYSAYSERRGEYEAFLRTTYIGLEVAATRTLGLGIPFRAAYTAEYGQTIAQPAVLCALFTTCDPAAQADAQRKLPLGVASVGVQRIRTDDNLEPTRGYVLSGEVRGSSHLLASDRSLEFLKTTGNAQWYHRGPGNSVLALRVGGGLISHNGSKLPPPQERLYAGGATSVRGYQQNELGPVAYLLDPTQFVIDTLANGDLTYVAKPDAGAKRTIPLGGNSQFVFSAELRIRDPFFPDLFEYVPFIDGGQVWTQTERRSLNLERPSVTPGLGLRIFSPVGPIQANVGYNPYRLRGGPAYFATPVDQNSTLAPLVCVTAPGVTPLPVHVVNGQLQQDIAACPNFVPSKSSSFWSHLQFTLSIGTGF